MIQDEEQIDQSNTGGFLLEHERELLKIPAETLRTFYSLTGAPRKDYMIQMAEAEAERIRIVRTAEAEGILAIRKAEAEGLKLIGDAIANTSQPDVLLKILALEAAEKMSQFLADGKATKLFLPQSLGDVFSVLGILKEFTNQTKATPEMGEAAG